MTAALPRTGEWFPRVELGAESRELRLLLRHAPPLGTGVRVCATGRLDPRTVPRRKGPDLDILARVRQRAAVEGADEAVLIAPSGVVLEGATTSVLWWEDDTLCLPSPQLPVLAGVTTALIQERAQRTGIRVAHRERTLADLDGREVWLVNALHGIRPVTEWMGGRSRSCGRARRCVPRNGGNGWKTSRSRCGNYRQKGRVDDILRPALLFRSRIQLLFLLAAADNRREPSVWRWRSGCTR